MYAREMSDDDAMLPLSESPMFWRLTASLDGWSVNVPTVTPVVPPATCANESGVGVVAASVAVPGVMVPEAPVWTCRFNAATLSVLPDCTPVGDGSYVVELPFTPAEKDAQLG